MDSIFFRISSILFPLLIFYSFSPLWAEEVAQNSPSNVAETEKTASDLLQTALSAQANGDLQEIADLFCEVHKEFPETAEAEEALWQCALFSKELAEAGQNDWEDIRDLFREYVTYYPEGKKKAQAYLEIGLALDRMGYHREALSYFKLCVKKFPKDMVASEAQLRQAGVLIRIGRIQEARSLYKKLADSQFEKVRLRAQVGLADIFNREKEYKKTLEIYHALAAKNPNFFRDDFEALRVFGVANLAIGQVEKGQAQLMHYLSLSGDSKNRADVLFVIGESYWKQKKIEAAQKMYKRVLEEEGTNNIGRRAFVFSKLRFAQYLDDPSLPHGRWDKVRDLKDPKGDQEYLTALDLFFEDPLAQAARLGLFWRFQARDDLENMMDYGKTYLRLARLNGGDGGPTLGAIFLALAEELLARQQYKELYNLYLNEYELVKSYPNGRLLYLVGQAVEALALYDQAAVIYWRALKWPLAEKDKEDLYLRRSRVYLAKEDFASAERLLSHLRNIYKGKKIFGEVAFYSGQLREAQKKNKEAMEFYRQALKISTYPEKKGEYVAAFVRLSLLLDGVGSMNEIRTLLEDGSVKGEKLQKTYLSVADLLRKSKKTQQAISLYEVGLSETLPQQGKTAQTLRLHLGDALLDANRTKEALKQFQMAAEGNDTLIQQLARERLNHNKIESELLKLKSDKGN